MKPKLRDGMLEAFARFPDYEFIWRLTRVDDNITALVSQYPNVHVSAWLQQSAILAHPKTRGFISHMGLNSLNEATHSGVPLVAVPFFGDQLLNTAMALKRGVAFYLSRREITTESLSHALSQILHSEKWVFQSITLIDHQEI
jgi:UDP:flavonoid glycosyltransferase YjiC (YdhE family)